jgi:hypothetical protein
MTVTRKQRNLLEDGETQMSSEMSSEERCLRVTALIFSKDLTTEEAQVWRNVLSRYSAKAIDYAFDQWNRKESFFPKPAQITEILDAYVLSHEPPRQRIYEPTGVGEAEILFLWKFYLSRFPKKPDRYMTERERIAFLAEFHAELEKVRGAA